LIGTGITIALRAARRTLETPGRIPWSAARGFTGSGRQLANRGFFYRFFGRWMKVITKEWQLYPVGVVFGLGFDSATEVALLATSGGVRDRGAVPRHLAGRPAHLAFRPHRGKMEPSPRSGTPGGTS